MADYINYDPDAWYDGKNDENAISGSVGTLITSKLDPDMKPTPEYIAELRSDLVSQKIPLYDAEKGTWTGEEKGDHLEIAHFDEKGNEVERYQDYGYKSQDFDRCINASFETRDDDGNVIAKGTASSDGDYDISEYGKEGRIESHSEFTSFGEGYDYVSHDTDEKYQYGDDGKLISKTTSGEDYNADDDESLCYENETEYHYEGDRLAYETSSERSDYNSFHDTHTRTDYKYDGSGEKVIGTSSRTYDDETGKVVGTKMVKIEGDKSSIHQMEVRESFSGSMTKIYTDMEKNGDVVTKSKEVRLNMTAEGWVESADITTVDGSRENRSEESYGYDENGRLSTINREGIDEMESTKISISRDENGNIDKITVKDPEGGKTVYAKDENGNFSVESSNVYTKELADKADSFCKDVENRDGQIEAAEKDVDYDPDKVEKDDDEADDDDNDKWNDFRDKVD